MTNLKVATYNIKHASIDGRYTLEIGKLIKDNEIDIIGIQEIDVNCKRSANKNIISEIANSSGYKYYKFFKTIDYQGGDYGIGILSKYEIIESVLYPLSYGSEKRVIGHAKIKYNDLIINFFVTHFDLGTYEDVRKNEFKETKELLNKYDNFILAGDFNVHDWTDPRNSFFEYQEYFSEYNLVNNKENTFYTFSGKEIIGGNILPLDNIVLSKNYKTINTKVVDTEYSDHDLLMTEVILN